MQDDLLMDKSKAQSQQHQESSNSEPLSTTTPSESLVLDEHNHFAMESPVLPGLAFPQEPSTFNSTWSTNTVDEGFFQGVPSVNGTMLFQNFPHHVNPVFTGSFSPQMRRSPLGVNQRNPYTHQTLLNKVSASSSAWNNHQNAVWSSAANPWSGRDPRRALGVGLGIASPLAPVSPNKKPFPSNVIAPPKYQRTGALQKPWMISEPPEPFRTDNGNNMLPFQERNRPFDPFNLQTLENSLMDMIKNDHDKGRMGLNFHHPATEHILPLNSEYLITIVLKPSLRTPLSVCLSPSPCLLPPLYVHVSPSFPSVLCRAARSYGRRRGRSSLFPFEEVFLDESLADAPMNSPNRVQNGDRFERYSRKVFVGGLPPDIDEDEITNSFRRFGHLVVDWPHKAESKSYFPPKGCASSLLQMNCMEDRLIFPTVLCLKSQAEIIVLTA
ncbi:hypothetical protein DNTS_029140 [Danionella cerebrum]|uniref:RRM domain-containing protein n=1 Tax=Danionella cerebrum TaxID=2873325 RepID=A0A553MRV9_9TELE|nr:hypothetical protein DNTS_029140 [Danionella translucida]